MNKISQIGEMPVPSMSNPNISQLIPEEEVARDRNRALAVLIGGKLAVYGRSRATFDYNDTQMVLLAEGARDPEVIWLEEVGIYTWLGPEIAAGTLRYLGVEARISETGLNTILPVFGPDGRLVQRATRIDDGQFMTVTNNWYFGEETGAGFMAVYVQHLTHEELVDVYGAAKAAQVKQPAATVYHQTTTIRLVTDDDRRELGRRLAGIQRVEPS